MKLIAKATVMIDDRKTVQPGEEFTCADDEAKTLVALGYAIEPDAHKKSELADKPKKS